MIVENDGLESLRQTTSKILLAVLWLHVPISVTIGLCARQGLADAAAIFMAIYRARRDRCPGACPAMASRRAWCFPSP